MATVRKLGHGDEPPRGVSDSLRVPLCRGRLVPLGNGILFPLVLASRQTTSPVLSPPAEATNYWVTRTVGGS